LKLLWLTNSAKYKTTFTLDFEGQVPVQIRRSGRNNSEGVALSMTQWYQNSQFDFEGWHADPYIENFTVFGDFDVNITIDKEYTLEVQVIYKTKTKLDTDTKMLVLT
jgi:hypothetical protein